ncbi:MAG: hypothetical protein NVSMB46_07950 [Candidatus Saccharimonadales bacterium]
MIAIILACATFFSTLLGGITALKNSAKINRILGYTAGVLIGVVAFDILPEIYRQINEHHIAPITPMIALVLGFLVFHILEKLILIHHAEEKEYGAHKHPQVGLVSALALSGHSFLDGVGIGLGFQVNSTVGIAVAIAVIAHDFADGLNTVVLMLTNKNTRKSARLLLILDAVAPVLGVLSTHFFHLPAFGLVLYLGFFAGFLLYIGASDILPQAHSDGSSFPTLILTILGTIFMYIVTRFA